LTPIKLEKRKKCKKNLNGYIESEERSLLVSRIEYPGSFPLFRFRHSILLCILLILSNGPFRSSLLKCGQSTGHKLEACDRWRHGQKEGDKQRLSPSLLRCHVSFKRSSLGSPSFLEKAVFYGRLKKPTEWGCLPAKQQASLRYLERTGSFLGDLCDSARERALPWLSPFAQSPLTETADAFSARDPPKPIKLTNVLSIPKCAYFARHLSFS